MTPGTTNAPVDPTDVIILGAGATKAEGGPLQGELFEQFFAELRYRENELPIGMAERLKKFFMVFFGIDIYRWTRKSPRYPTFEEALGMLDLALQRNESFRDYDQSPVNPDIQAVRQDLTFLIALVLEWKLSGDTSVHQRLVERLERERVLRHTAFLSLNYDILIDNALASRQIWPIYHLDYGIPFTNMIPRWSELALTTPGDLWYEPEPDRAVRLMKLHGSLNWLYCPTCVKMTIKPKENGAVRVAVVPEPCRSCETKVIPIIIPPTFFKVMSNHFLQQVWRTAEETLAKAQRLFICGYSFPDADLHFKYLLKRAEVNRKTEPPQVYVINHAAGKPKKQYAEEEQRYKRFFKHAGHNVHMTDLSFKSFAKDGI